MGLGDLSPEGSIVLGVFVGLLSTSVQSLGLTLQRKSHILEDEKEFQDLRRPPYRRRRWQLGMLMFVVSNLVGSTIQITTLPLPVLSTLQASGLVFNSLCATLILGEAFTRYSLAGTILVCGGALLIAIFGSIAEPSHTLSQLLELLGRKQFVIWIAGQAVLVIAIIIIARVSKLISPYSSNSPRMRLFRGMAYGCISGILSAHSLLVAKSAVELLVRTIVDHNNQFHQWQSWIILLSLITLALSQLYYLHRGLKLCSTSILYPFVFCVYNIIAILDGLIYFNQTSRLTLLHALLIALGTVILLTGVVCLSWRLHDDKSPVPNTIPQTTLTPGMGLIPSPTSSSSASSLYSRSPSPASPPTPDEESRLLPIRTRTLPIIDRASTAKHYGAVVDSTTSRSIPPTSTADPNPNTSTPASGTRPKRTVHYAPDTSPGPKTISPRTPQARAPRHRRRQTDEIWDELEEDSPPAIRFTRRHSVGTGSSLRSSMESPKTVETVRLLDGEQAGEDGSGTFGLKRSSTGRSYRDKKKRKERDGDGEGSTEGRERGREGREEDMQGALGGWWKMKRWWKGEDARTRGRGRDDKGKGKARAEDV